MVVFDAAVDGLGRAVARADAVEVGHHIDSASFQGSSERDQLQQGFGHACSEGGDELFHQPAPVGGVRLAPVQGVAFASSMPVEPLLDTAAALVQCFASELDDVEPIEAPRPRRAAPHSWQF